MTLLYKATRDGFGAYDFHSRCDHKGATLTIYESNYGYVFGGYASISWTSEDSYRKD